MLACNLCRISQAALVYPNDHRNEVADTSLNCVEPGEKPELSAASVTGGDGMGAELNFCPTVLWLDWNRCVQLDFR